MKTPRLVMLLAAVAIIVTVILAGPSQATASPTARFIVIAPHTKEECLKALDEVKATSTKLLEKCDWGCMAGDHTCYLILEAKDEAAARKMLPASWSGAKVQSLNKFTAAQIESFHKK